MSAGLLWCSASRMLIGRPAPAALGATTVMPESAFSVMTRSTMRRSAWLRSHRSSPLAIAGLPRYAAARATSAASIFARSVAGISAFVTVTVHGTAGYCRGNTIRTSSALSRTSNGKSRAIGTLTCSAAAASGTSATSRVRPA